MKMTKKMKMKNIKMKKKQQEEDNEHLLTIESLRSMLTSGGISSAPHEARAPAPLGHVQLLPRG